MIDGIKWLSEKITNIYLTRQVIKEENSCSYGLPYLVISNTNVSLIHAAGGKISVCDKNHVIDKYTGRFINCYSNNYKSLLKSYNYIIANSLYNKL